MFIVRVNRRSSTESVRGPYGKFLMLKGVRHPQDHKKMTNRLLMIQPKGASNEHLRGPPVANIFDGPGGVTAPGLKSIALVGDISGSCGGGWGRFMGPRSMLVTVGSCLSV